MIINGGSRSARVYWTKHLQRADTNERVTVIELRGLAGETIDEALRDMEIMALGTRCTNFMYHANINPRADEVLTPEQWTQAVDQLEKNLGYDGLPRVVVEHAKHGRTHQHVIWSRIDPDLMIARSDSLTARIHEQTSRELEITFGLERGQSVLVPNREEPRPERRPQSWETFRGHESGIALQDVAAQVRELYAQAEHGQAFAHALDEAGYLLSQGDKRVYVILDHAGKEHSLGRRAGVKAQALREFMADVPLASLPTVAEARAQWRERDHSPTVEQEPARTEAQTSQPEHAAPSYDAEEPLFTRLAEVEVSQQPPMSQTPDVVEPRQPEREEHPTPAREAPAPLRMVEPLAKTVETAGRAAGIAGHALGGVIRLAEPLIGAIVDFFTAPSNPTPTREALQEPPRERTESMTPQQQERLRRTTPEVAVRDPEVQQQARAGNALNMPPELQAALRRRAEEIARERGDRDRDRGRER